MTSLKYYEIAFYPILALMGISLITRISKAIENKRISLYFYYIGKHTMPILALHMTVFKLISFIKIKQYDMTIDHLAEFPVIFSDYQAIMGASRMITGSNWIDTLKGRTLSVHKENRPICVHVVAPNFSREFRDFLGLNLHYHT